MKSGDLELRDVNDHLDVVDLRDVEERGPGFDELAHLHVFPGDLAIYRTDDARICEVPFGRSEPGLGDLQLPRVDPGLQVGLIEGVLRGHLILVEVDLPLGVAFRFLEVGPGHL